MRIPVYSLQPPFMVFFLWLLTTSFSSAFQFHPSSSSPLFSTNTNVRLHNGIRSSSVFCAGRKCEKCNRKLLKPKTMLYAVVNDDVIESSFEQIKEQDNGRKISGALVLLTVPLAWGTYAPVVKYMYEIDPPIPGLVFSAGYYIVAAVTLLLLNFFMNQNEEIKSNQQMNQSLPIQGGLELGSYLFIGNCLQVVGLESIPADRAAFEVQLTTVIVPLLQGIIGSQFGGVSRQTWLATALAFVGVFTMGMEGQAKSTFVNDSMSRSILGNLSLQGGDLLIFLAALAYSFHVIRLGNYAPNTSAVSLAAAKASTEALLSIALVAALFLSGDGTSFGSDVVRFVEAIQSGITASSDFIVPATLSCLWTGLVTCAYTIFAQSYGQSSVSPSNANLIYASQPLFSSLFAYILLGEVLGSYGYLGGAFIAAAVLLITSQDSKAPST